MKTAIQKNLTRGVGLALLLATGLSLSSCIIVDPYHRHHHHRHYSGWEAPTPYHHEVRP